MSKLEEIYDGRDEIYAKQPNNGDDSEHKLLSHLRKYFF